MLLNIILISAIVVCLVIIIQIGYVNYKLYNENKNREEFIYALATKLIDVKFRLEAIDKNGSFSSDDEVGFFFDEIKKLHNELLEYFDVKHNDN